MRCLPDGHVRSRRVRKSLWRTEEAPAACSLRAVVCGKLHQIDRRVFLNQSIISPRLTVNMHARIFFGQAFDSRSEVKVTIKSSTEKTMEQRRYRGGPIGPIANFARAAGFLLVGAGLTSGCGKKAAPAGQPAAMPVSVVEVKPTQVPITGEWVGTLDGYVNAQIQ